MAQHTEQTIREKETVAVENIAYLVRLFTIMVSTLNLIAKGRCTKRDLLLSMPGCDPEQLDVSLELLTALNLIQTRWSLDRKRAVFKLRRLPASNIKETHNHNENHQDNQKPLE